MTRAETTQVLAILKAAYPMFYRDMQSKDVGTIINLWASMFTDDDYLIVLAAVKAHIATDEKGFPPTIGVIKTAIFKATDCAYAITADEAWEIARNTMRTIGISAPIRVLKDGEYISKTSIEQAAEITPPAVWEIMKHIGYSDMCRSENLDVLRGQFIKLWNTSVERRRERTLIPRDVQKLISTVQTGMIGESKK